MTENNPPIYQEVLDELKIDPEDQTFVDHEERFQAIKDASPSSILNEETNGRDEND